MRRLPAVRIKFNLASAGIALCERCIWLDVPSLQTQTQSSLSQPSSSGEVRKDMQLGKFFLLGKFWPRIFRKVSLMSCSLRKVTHEHSQSLQAHSSAKVSYTFDCTWLKRWEWMTTSQRQWGTRAKRKSVWSRWWLSRFSCRRVAWRLSHCCSAASKERRDSGENEVVIWAYRKRFVTGGNFTCRRVECGTSPVGHTARWCITVGFCKPCVTIFSEYTGRCLSTDRRKRAPGF